MTIAHYDIADRLSETLTNDSPLRAVLAQRSAAYGTVAGALETLMGASLREQDTTREFLALVDAIHAPRAEAERIATELYHSARGLLRSSSEVV